MAEIGATLREARMRARIDVSEIEAQTKIRAKYLRALENEEWGLLPGPTFVKSFLRTYAEALGLDGRALVEEYRLENERGETYEPIVPAAQRRTAGGRQGRSGRRGPSGAYIAALTIVCALIVLLIVLLLSGGGSGQPAASTGSAATTGPAGTSTAKKPSTPPAQPVALSLKATAGVYVCLVGDHGRVYVRGSELQEGQSTPTFHSRRFLLTLGNSSVVMYVDGVARTVPASSSPIGYIVTKAHGRRPAPTASLPSCK